MDVETAAKLESLTMMYARLRQSHAKLCECDCLRIWLRGGAYGDWDLTQGQDSIIIEMVKNYTIAQLKAEADRLENQIREIVNAKDAGGAA